MLELGCGNGATSRAVINCLPKVSLTGIVKKKQELRSCKRRVPEAKFNREKGPIFRFKRNTFEAVISLEGLRQFGNSIKLFKEILRILTPGGQLVFSDFLFDTNGTTGTVKNRNIAQNLYGIEAFLTSAGFHNCTTYDTTNICWRGLQNHFYKTFSPKLIAREMSRDLFDLLIEQMPDKGIPVKTYYICTATKKIQQP